MENSFTELDYNEAKEAFSAWQSSISESIDEYLLRKRKAELNELVCKVIRQELAPSDRLIVELHWYEGLSNKEIAQKLNLEPYQVSRRINKINDVIYEKLKYAIEYRYTQSFLSEARLIIRSKQAAYVHSDPQSLAQRLKDLRERNFFSVEDVSTMTGISPRKIIRLEEGADSLSAEQAMKYAIAFRTSTDYIISGKQTK